MPSDQPASAAQQYGSAEHAAREALTLSSYEGWVNDSVENVAAIVVEGLRQRGFVVMNEPRCECGWNGTQNHMHDMRMRVGEVTQLDVASIRRDPGRGWVGFVGKGDQYDEIDLDYATLAILDRYLAGRTDGPLFLNQWDNRLTRENVQTILNRSCRNCGITYPVTPHTLRRTNARTAAEQGADIYSIAQGLRHKDPKTTMPYTGNATGRGSAARRLVSDLMVQMTSPVT